MADSNITKRALSSALRDLMEEMPFEKITVAEICAKCDMNRKSFYYHFKDKYDLINWIFDTEFISFIQMLSASEHSEDRFKAIYEICSYFDKNRSFYRKAFKIKGQNSFSEHFREWCQLLLKQRLTYLIGEDEANDFAVDFFSDACLGSIERWIMDKNPMSPEEFTARIKSLILNGTKALYKELNPTEPQTSI